MPTVTLTGFNLSGAGIGTPGFVNGRTIQFTIPSGITVTAAAWNSVASWVSAGTSTLAVDTYPGSGSSVNLATHSGTGTFTDSGIAASGAQVTDIQNAVGTTLTATLYIPSGSTAIGITSLQLVLTYTAMGGGGGAMGLPSRELDVRVYDATGKRKLLNAQDWISTLNFEIGEQGGCLNGSIQFEATWEQLQLVGTEYVDIRLWGNLLYRGWLRTPQNEIAAPEKASPSLFGLMELLNGFQVRQDIVYPAPTSIDVVFSDLAAQYVTTASRLPALVIDTTGVAALSILVQTFKANGKSFSQAMNALCDLAPGQLIWGSDVDGSGNSRLYLRPRATSVKYVYPVGDKVSHFVYPQDATQVVNRVILSGGKVTYPNLLTNASFEEQVVPGETTSNLLVNGSFESGLTGWTAINSPTVASANGRTGANALDMDNNPSATEGVYQDVSVSANQPVSASSWANASPAEAWQYTIKMEAFTAGNVSLGSVSTATITVDATVLGSYVYKHSQLDWTTPATTAYVRVTYQLTATTPGTGGMNLDDCAFWISKYAQAKGWKAGAGSGGYWSLLDWNNHDTSVPAVEPGVTKVKAQATITGGAGSYAEITCTEDSRPSVKPYHTYTLAFRCRGGSAAASVQIGARLLKADGTVTATVLGTLTSVLTGLWQLLSVQVTTAVDTSTIEPFVRLQNAASCYIDAAQLWETSPTSQDYTPDDTYRLVKSTADYAAIDIGAAQAASITTWGEREADVSNENVIDTQTADAFLKGYFRNHAIPVVQAKLTIKGATAPLSLDGQVKLTNLPTPPPALAPAKVRYTVGETIDIDADLNSERPDLALLLRLVTGNG